MTLISTLYIRETIAGVSDSLKYSRFADCGVWSDAVTGGDKRILLGFRGK